MQERHKNEIRILLLHNGNVPLETDCMKVLCKHVNLASWSYLKFPPDCSLHFGLKKVAKVTEAEICLGRVLRGWTLSGTIRSRPWDQKEPFKPPKKIRPYDLGNLLEAKLKAAIWRKLRVWSKTLYWHACTRLSCSQMPFWCHQSNGRNDEKMEKTGCPGLQRPLERI